MASCRVAPFGSLKEIASVRDLADQGPGEAGPSPPAATKHCGWTGAGAGKTETLIRRIIYHLIYEESDPAAHSGHHLHRQGRPRHEEQDLRPAQRHYTY